MTLFYNTTLTPTTIATYTVNCGFQPIAMEVIVSAKGSNPYAHLSTGSVDSTGYAVYHGFFYDVDGGQTYKDSGFNKQIVGVRERVSGTITEVNSAKLNSFNATNAKIDVAKVDSSYQYNVKVWG